MLLAFLSDIHFDHECPYSWALTKAILKDLPIDHVILGGDIIDLGPLSIFKAAPHEKLALGDQIRHSRKELRALRNTVGDIPISYFNGNHEERLEYHIWQRTPELAALQDEDLNILTMNHMFQFDATDIVHVRQTPMRVKKMWFFHGHEINTRAVHVAKTNFMSRSGNGMCGHHHRFDSYLHQEFSHSQSILGSFVNATLEQIPAIHDVRNPSRWIGYSKWQNGISLVDFSEGGYFRVEQLLYIREAASRMRTHVYGKVFRAIRKKGKIDIVIDGR